MATKNIGSKRFLTEQEYKDIKGLVGKYKAAALVRLTGRSAATIRLIGSTKDFGEYKTVTHAQYIASPKYKGPKAESEQELVKEVAHISEFNPRIDPSTYPTLDDLMLKLEKIDGKLNTVIAQTTPAPRRGWIKK